MKKKFASQLVRRSLAEGGFFNLRILTGLFTVLTGIYLALLSFGVFSAQAQQKQYIITRPTDPLVPAGFDCSRIHQLGINKQENLRAGAIMIACGEAQEGAPSFFRTFSQFIQELMAPLTYGTTDLDLITGTETYADITQSETFTAANPDNPDQIVVAYNDLRGRNFSPINISGASVSTDGGTTFTRLTKANGQSPFDNALGDPVILYNKPTQTWFTAWIDQGCGSQGIGGYKSTTPRDPNSWTHYCVHNGSSDDRESGYADNNPSSPHYGNMYISYNDFVVGEGALSVRVSTDNGLTWTNERQLTSGTPFVRNVQITGDLVTGDVYIAGMDEGGGGFPHNNTNVVFRSTDGGNTWTNTYTGPAFPGPGVTAVGYWPCMFADGGGYWRHQGWGQPAAFNHVVHLVYAQHGAGSDPADVYYIRSTDSGVTFGAPFKLNSDPFARPQWQPNISVSPAGTLLAVWYDARESASCALGNPAVPCYRMFSRKSTDNGLSWLPDLQFSDVVTPLPAEPSSGVESTYAGDYDYGSAVLTRHFTAWTDGRVIINAASQQDAFFDSEAVSPTPNPTVTPSPLPGPITLGASGRKVGGINTVDLTWSPFGPPINVYRNGVQLATIANLGTYTDSTGDRGSATYTYQVCEAGTSTCSNTVVVIFGNGGSTPTPSPSPSPTATATATATVSVTPTATVPPPTPTATATFAPTPTATATATATVTPTPTASPTPTCTWVNEPPMNNARGLLATAVVGPYLYAISGFDSVTGVSAANERFDGVTWTTMAHIPKPIVYARAAVVGNNIYVPGGNWPYGSWDAMQIYNTETDTWSYGANLPQPREGMATVAFNGLVYMIAGSNSTVEPTSDVFIYHPAQDRYTTGRSMPDVQGRDVAGVLFNGEIYVVGGQNSPGAHYVYNPTTNRWRTIASLPTSHGTCVGAGKGFVLNGAVWIVGCGSWIYDPDADAWRQGPSNLVSRARSSAELFNGRGFVVGGATAAWEGSATVESIDCPNPSPTPTPTATATPTATPTPVTLMLTASGRKVNKINTVDLSWSPSGSSPNVDIKRNGVLITTTPNDGAYTDSTGDRGPATYTYQVCEAGISNCSNIVSVSFGGGR